MSPLRVCQSLVCRPNANAMKRSMRRSSLAEITASAPPGLRILLQAWHPSGDGDACAFTHTGAQGTYWPASRRCQASSTLHPRGETKPKPVMTTRRPMLHLPLLNPGAESNFIDDDRNHK
jgi:hypothetical protein